MAPLTTTRLSQSVSTGLGRHLVSPRKPRGKRKSQVLFKMPFQDSKRRELLANLERLMKGEEPEPKPQPSSTNHVKTEEDSTLDIFGRWYKLLKRPKTLELSAKRLHGSWKRLIPTLIRPQLDYRARTFGKTVDAPLETLSLCTKRCSPHKRVPVICLFFDQILSCPCSTLPQILVHHGLFPTAPSQPRLAISIELLSFYRALFERSRGATKALSSALHTHYWRRGFKMTNSQNLCDAASDMLYNGFDTLQVEIERHVDNTMQHGRNPPPPHAEIILPSHIDTPPPSPSDDVPSPRQASVEADTVPSASHIPPPPPENSRTIHPPPSVLSNRLRAIEENRVTIRKQDGEGFSAEVAPRRADGGSYPYYRYAPDFVHRPSYPPDPYWQELRQMPGPMHIAPYGHYYQHGAYGVEGTYRMPLQDAPGSFLSPYGGMYGRSASHPYMHGWDTPQPDLHRRGTLHEGMHGRMFYPEAGSSYSIREPMLPGYYYPESQRGRYGGRIPSAPVRGLHANEPALIPGSSEARVPPTGRTAEFTATRLPAAQPKNDVANGDPENVNLP
ncbi:hypothetical protein SERLA73DRAFT_77540 [Serpula lacrymans var. lacrymans S7.3]|uniref:Uncharacterized protein n=2 Tax=Serpula lacrymans var. lacrymans TaxID=341189 RepID=F8QAL2_SERL3|nr:uncharacterized protein SERLADRAFT_442439 [Serpula lacrymans var. lacrymans S7.9]EGN94802.1 hypothetical protein SERLA73DRAFT_77540 [Serpula lacrymans var. lacrymans S7.3]EGO20300.1 hypothetical protein SERLADRAFT_442439 [Serpula lacrymans var. lacrymans S7.9]